MEVNKAIKSLLEPIMDGQLLSRNLMGSPKWYYKGDGQSFVKDCNKLARFGILNKVKNEFSFNWDSWPKVVELLELNPIEPEFIAPKPAYHPAQDYVLYSKLDLHQKYWCILNTDKFTIRVMEGYSGQENRVYSATIRKGYEEHVLGLYKDSVLTHKSNLYNVMADSECFKGDLLEESFVNDLPFDFSNTSEGFFYGGVFIPTQIPRDGETVKQFIANGLYFKELSVTLQEKMVAIRKQLSDITIFMEYVESHGGFEKLAENYIKDIDSHVEGKRAEILKTYAEKTR